MSTNSKDIIDGVLAKRYLKIDDSSDIIKEFEAIQAIEFGNIMSVKKKDKLIDKAVIYLNEKTFGHLLKSVDPELVHIASNEIGLNKDFLTKLYQDKILINRVPIVRVKKFLEQIDLSFHEAKKAILRTANLLSNQAEMSGFGSFQVAFRKKSMGGTSVSWGGDFKSDLFDNQEALEKYLDKLEGLMKE